jgi:hypothetical protein
MTTTAKIRQLYNLSSNDNFGFEESEINAMEQNFGIKLPVKLRNYYLTLGKAEAINYSYNRLLIPNKKIRLSKDGLLVFYEENQCVAHWGIKEQDLILDNPPVWGNYGTEENPDLHIEADSTTNFLLLMAVYNGTMGGLNYNANCFGQIPLEKVKLVEKNWKLVPEISWNKQKVYTDSYQEVLSLTFGEEHNCTGIFVGTNHQDKFDKILDQLELPWSYISYEDEDGEEDE